MRRVALLQWGVVFLVACQPQPLEAYSEFDIEAMVRMYPRSGIQIQGGLAEQAVSMVAVGGDTPLSVEFMSLCGHVGEQECEAFLKTVVDPPMSSMAATGQAVSLTEDVHHKMWIEGMVHPESSGIATQTATTSIMYEWLALDSEDVAVDYIVDWNIDAETDGLGQRIYGEVGARVSGGIGPSGSPATVWEIAGPELWDVENGQGFGSAQSRLMASSFDAVEGDSGWLKFELYFENSVEVAAPPPEPAIYGLFLGIEDKGVNGQNDAQKLYNTMASNLTGFKEGVLLTANRDQGGLTNQQVEQAIDQLSAKMQAGDTFIFYDSSHGGSFTSGLETTDSPGDEFLALGSNLSDDSLMSYLTGMDDIAKWVMLDSCHSGGFWGNDNPDDTGDLEKLSNIALFAASGEDTMAFGWPITYEGMFTSSLNAGFSLDGDGYMKADTDRSGNLAFEELDDWIDDRWFLQLMQNPTVVYERAQGDLLDFTSDMWSPVSMASPDFGGSLSGGELAPVPVPGAVLLGAIGLSFAGWRLRRRTTGELKDCE